MISSSLISHHPHAEGFQIWTSRWGLSSKLLTHSIHCLRDLGTLFPNRLLTLYVQSSSWSSRPSLFLPVFGIIPVAQPKRHCISSLCVQAVSHSYWFYLQNVFKVWHLTASTAVRSHRDFLPRLFQELLLQRSSCFHPATFLTSSPVAAPPQLLSHWPSCSFLNIHSSWMSFLGWQYPAYYHTSMPGRNYILEDTKVCIWYPLSSRFCHRCLFL